MTKKTRDDETQVHMEPRMDPRLMQAMYGGYEEDEIDLLEYWNVIWNKRVFILKTAFVSAVVVAGLSLLMPNIYKAETLLAPMGGDEKVGMSSMLGGLGSLASMAGVSMSGGGSAEQNLAVLQSRAFIWSFVKDEKLMPLLFEDAWDAETQQWKAAEMKNQPSLWDAYRLLTGVLTTNMDKDSGLVRVAISWKDPELATEWVKALVVRLNAHLREYAVKQSNEKLDYLEKELARTHVAENRQALFELISKEQKQAMLANTQQDFAFRVIDEAVVPDKKVKPKRAIIVILSAFVVGFLCVVFVLIQEGMRKRKEEEESLKDEE